MSVEVCRIDDRLIHGQVVVGWGQPLGIGLIVLVDDSVAHSEWEQDLYRMGVPPGMDVAFVSVHEAIERLPRWTGEGPRGLLLTGDIDTMRRLTEGSPLVRTVNLGGIHHSPGRTQRLRYIFLTPGEEATLKMMEAAGTTITAQDVPATRPVPLAQLLAGCDLT
ncbi:MAG: PTS sugar transporter subunit IIB [Gemmatimonadetes bacterium]|nr:PTS sugar transporter subunit IIB [Gemmatimonadota bacterium]